MPGFMGIRGLDTGDGRQRGRERRDEAKQSARFNREQRSMEKVREILRGQEGVLEAFNDDFKSEDQESCARLANRSLASIMSTRVVSVSFDDTLYTVQGIFSSVRFHHLPVVDSDGAIIGILSDRDFLRAVSPFFGTINEQNRDKEIMSRKVGLVMTRNPLCASSDVSILDAARTMNGRRISCIPVVDPESCSLLGMVTWKDVVRVFCPQVFAPGRESTHLPGGKHTATDGDDDGQPREPDSLPREAPGYGAGEALPGTDRSARLRPDDASSHLSLQSPQVGQQEPLSPSTAGQAGSRLAHIQEERIREDYGD